MGSQRVRHEYSTVNSFTFKLLVVIPSANSGHWMNLVSHLSLSERKWKSLSCINSLWFHGLYIPWNFPGQNTGVGSLFLLQGIFPTQGLNSGLPHCRRFLYQLSHKRSPRILEWVAYPSPADFPDLGLNRGLLHCRQILFPELWGKPINSTYLSSALVARGRMIGKEVSGSSAVRKGRAGT